jgi:hypothetical protein
LVGEFIRRHHTRIAHEIILNGVPTDNANTIKVNFDNIKLLDVAGLIARSHGYELREAIDLLNKTQKKQYLDCHIPFIMGVLRIADYIQIHSSRAPKQLIKIKKLVSPISKDESKKHIAIDNIHLEHDDPEALFVETEPNNVRTFLLLKSLFKNIQYEMDSFWANVGEIYGRHEKLNKLGIVLRRIRSSIDYTDEFVNDYEPCYVPESLSFKAADTEMLNLLVKPLYGDNPEIGIRELLQNALDACREKYNYLLNHNPSEAKIYRDIAEVKIDLFKEKDIYKVSIEDNGLGMNRDVIKNYFFNIGASFRNSDSWKKENISDDGNSQVLRTGRFGIGVLAAFLLGEEINVNTKYINDNLGYKFSARIDDEFIEMNYTDESNTGTKISVDIDHKTYKELSDSSKWDWFCLTWPKVTRTIDSKVLEQSISSFKDEKVLPKDFFDVKSNDFENIIWSYSLEQKSRRYYSKKDKYFRGLICNGIKIQDTFSYNFEILIASSPSISVEVPALIVFDQNGRLPINLQRNSLATYKLSFLDDLEDSISKYYVNDLLKKLSIIKYDISDNIFLEYKNTFFKELDYSYQQISNYPKITIFKNEYLPFDYTLMNLVKPSTIIFEPSENGCNVGSLLFSKGFDCIIPINNPDKTISSRIYSIRQLFYDGNLNFNLENRALIIRKSEMEELGKKSNFPKSMLKGSREVKINDSWSMYSQWGFNTKGTSNN